MLWNNYFHKNMCNSGQKKLWRLKKITFLHNFGIFFQICACLLTDTDVPFISPLWTQWAFSLQIHLRMIYCALISVKIFNNQEVDYHNMVLFCFLPLILNFVMFAKCPLIDIGMSVNRLYFHIIYFLFLSSPILVKFKTVERLPSPGRASARHRFPWQPFTVLNLTKIGVFRHDKKTLVLPLEAKIDNFSVYEKRSCHL